jgi:hypothetical protein
MKNSELQISVEPALKRALEKAARDKASSLPLFIEKVLSEHLSAKGYLPIAGRHGIPISQLNAENDG